MFTSIDFLWVKFCSVVVPFFSHQKGPHPFGNEHKHHAANKAIHRIETEQAFPGVYQMPMNNEVEDKQDSAAKIEEIKDSLNIFGIVKKMLFFSRHYQCLY